MSDENKQNWWEKDSDGDGVPDVVEGAIAVGRDAKARFGPKVILAWIMIGVVCLIMGFGAWKLSDTMDELTNIKNQFAAAKVEARLEKDKAVMAERDRVLAELRKKYDLILKQKTVINNQRTTEESVLENGSFKRRIKDETDKLNSTDVANDFSALGFPAKPRISGE